MLAAGDAIDKMFNDLIGAKISTANQEHYVALTITQKNLQDGDGRSQPIYINSKVARFDPQEFLNRIYEVAQSNDSFLVDGILKVDIAITRKYEGSGFASKNSQKPQTIEQQLHSSQSVITIKNTGVSCGYWAAGLALFLKQHPQLKGQDRSRYRQNKGGLVEKLGKELCHNAGLDYNKPMDNYDMELLDLYLAPCFQLIVIDGKATKNRIHVGSDAPEQIYLLLYKEHYYMVTTITGLMKRQFWCHKCWVGYNTEGSRKCAHTCPQCLQPRSCSPDEEIITCPDCKRSFHGKMFKL